MRVRFHLDENVPVAIAYALRRRLIDVSLTSEEDLMGATDLEQLEFAKRQQRVFVTQDKDFIRLHRAGNPHWGIVYWRQESVKIGAAVRHLILIHDLMNSEEMRNKLEFA